MGWIDDESGQVSAELLVLVAAIIAVALVLVSQLQNTALKGKKAVSEASEKVFKEISDIK
ncbi:hypothetical protein HUU53_02005 [Candidatus Micrarchaeota archaeon]|nr:hypothetical protein [Candidatus Micrarchaeota archaeon]